MSTSSAKTLFKDPDAVLDYRWDWTQWLPTGDTISTHLVLLAEGDVNIDSDSHDDTSVTVWLSAGTVDTTARVTVRISTAQNRTDDRTMTLQIRQR